jgi:hypothetical protein
MKELAMAGILAAAAALALPAETRADWRVGVAIGRSDREFRGPRDGWRGGDSAARYGYDRGWREGSREGRRDGRRSRDPRYWREGDFRDADDGFKRWMGSRREYMRGYRDGYSQGYRRAYASARPGWRDREYARDRNSRDYDDRYRNR